VAGADGRAERAVCARKRRRVGRVRVPASLLLVLLRLGNYEAT
jgi:hypothetical protein